MIGSLLDNLKSSLLRFKTDKEYNELIRTSFLALLVRMIGVLTGFFVTLLTSRFFGADALGLVSICIAILSFASVFGKLGLDVALMKYVAGTTWPICIFILKGRAHWQQEGLKTMYPKK